MQYSWFSLHCPFLLSSLFLFENSFLVSPSSITFSFSAPLRHIFLTFFFRCHAILSFQVVMQSSPFSCYAVLHTYESSHPSFCILSCHTTSWMKTSVQCYYLYSFLVHVLKFLFCTIYNSSVLYLHT